MKTISSSDISNKRVLLRLDLNVPIENGLILDDSRIKRTIPTINHLLNNGNKVIIITHFGRPEGKPNAKYSLKHILNAVESNVGKKVVFLDEIPTSLPKGNVFLLENLRFNAGEEANDSKFANHLSALGDVYVNDAFSASHREHASIVGINLPSYAGLLMEEELSNLDSIINVPGSVGIIGGKKVSTKFKVLEFLASKLEYLIVAGGMANTLVKAKGYDVGKSYYEEIFIEESKEFLRKKHKAQIILPQDFVTKSDIEINVAKIDAIKGSALDVGPKTLIEYAKIIDKSKIVFWNGPLGVYEDERFNVGTRFLAEYIISSNIKSVVGGGDVIAATKDYTSGFSYVSTGGGALLEFLENGTLPGIERLKQVL